LPAAEVGRFLLSKDTPATDSRLKHSLSPSTASSWLVAASRSGLEQQVQLCIDYFVGQDTQVEFDLASLAPAHSNKLLAAMQRKLSENNKDMLKATNFKAEVVKHVGDGTLQAYYCLVCRKSWVATSCIECCRGSYSRPTSVPLPPM
jgi:hypothetical protein